MHGTRVLQIYCTTRKQLGICRYDSLELRPTETDFIIETLGPMGALSIAFQNEKKSAVSQLHRESNMAPRDLALNDRPCVNEASLQYSWIAHQLDCGTTS